MVWERQHVVPARPGPGNKAEKGCGVKGHNDLGRREIIHEIADQLRDRGERGRVAAREKGFGGLPGPAPAAAPSPGPGCGTEATYFKLLVGSVATNICGAL